MSYLPVVEQNLREDSYVNALIDSELCTWNDVFILTVFPPYVADQIIKIPLTWRIDYQLLWGGNKTGLYSVKLGYHFAMNLMINENRAESSRASVNSEFSLRLWNLKLSNKVKNFAWRT